jgi:hypothetical protein
MIPRTFMIHNESIRGDLAAVQYKNSPGVWIGRSEYLSHPGRGSGEDTSVKYIVGEGKGIRRKGVHRLFSIRRYMILRPQLIL